MLEANYPNLFLDAGIDDPGDRAKYGRCLDAVLAEEGIAVSDIFGIGERGTSSNLDLYVVHRQAIALAREKGVFNKRIEVRRQCATRSIARVRTTQEGMRGDELTVTANDSAGAEVLKISWGLGGPDWVEPLILRQQDRLFRLIGEAMERLSDVPDRPSVSLAPSKASALRDWATDVVRAAEVNGTGEIVEEHANMIAGTINFTVFLRFGAAHGIDDLNQFYPSGEMPPGTPISDFDDLYAHVVARIGDPQVVDQAIDAQLAGAWTEYVNGCRESFS